jgi:hypothetical protein
VPGPGSETSFQKFCGSEYLRVFEIARRMIRDGTRIPADQGEYLARRIASAHSDAVYEHLTGERPSIGGRAVIPDEHEVRRTERRRSAEMHPGVTDARMGV